MSELPSELVGKSVTLHVSSSGLIVALRCKFLGESRDALHIRIDDSWDVDVFKDMVNSLELDRPSPSADSPISTSRTAHLPACLPQPSSAGPLTQQTCSRSQSAPAAN